MSSNNAATTPFTAEVEKSRRRAVRAESLASQP